MRLGQATRLAASSGHTGTIRLPRKVAVDVKDERTGPCASAGTSPKRTRWSSRHLVHPDGSRKAQGPGRAELDTRSRRTMRGGETKPARPPHSDAAGTGTGGGQDEGGSVEGRLPERSASRMIGTSVRSAVRRSPCLPAHRTAASRPPRGRPCPTRHRQRHRRGRHPALHRGTRGPRHWPVPAGAGSGWRRAGAGERVSGTARPSSTPVPTSGMGPTPQRAVRRPPWCPNPSCCLRPRCPPCHPAGQSRSTWRRCCRRCQGPCEIRRPVDRGRHRRPRFYYDSQQVGEVLFPVGALPRTIELSAGRATIGRRSCTPARSPPSTWPVPEDPAVFYTSTPRCSPATTAPGRWSTTARPTVPTSTSRLNP